jgi:hypothetical protein
MDRGVPHYQIAHHQGFGGVRGDLQQIAKTHRWSAQTLEQLS